MNMESIKRDLNFFKVYKDGPETGKGNGLKGLFITVICFVLITGAVFGVLYLSEESITRRTEGINQALSDPQIAALQKELIILKSKNELLYVYLASVNTAKKNFDQSRKIDTALFTGIVSAMPGDVIVRDTSVTQKSITLSCTCADELSPAVFMQGLKDKNLFSGITYGGITAEDAGRYSFTMNCLFGG